MDAQVLTHTEWMLRLDLELLRRAGVSHHDLPDHNYRAEYEANRAIEEVAALVLAKPDDAERIAKAKAADERIAEQMTGEPSGHAVHKHETEPPTPKRRGRQPRRTTEGG